MRIHYLQHVPFENPGSILIWAANNNYSVTSTQLYNNEEFPEQEEFDWLVIMGGPMNIYQEDLYPWLAKEKQFIKEAIHLNKFIVGLCLGGQLIADAIGGRVIQNHCKEIGWFPVMMSDQALASPYFSFFPKNPMVFQWHGDTFVDLPKEAIMIAGNEACTNQAFLYRDRVFGFQFHLENMMTIIKDLILNCSDEMVFDLYVQSEEELISHPEYIEADNQLMTMLLTKMAIAYENEYK